LHQEKTTISIIKRIETTTNVVGKTIIKAIIARSSSLRKTKTSLRTSLTRTITTTTKSKKELL